VTYILDGHMLHEDHLGNKGNLKSGGVQWMTAGRGIIHSEMPQQDRGRNAGLPALDQPAGKGQDEARELPRPRGGRHPGSRVAGRRQGRSLPANTPARAQQ